MDTYEKRTKLELATLYSCIEDPHGIKGEIDYGRYSDSKSIWINSGTVNIYSSNSLTKPYLISQMTLSSLDTSVSGLTKLSNVPKWLYITQNSGTSTEIIVSGVSTIDKGVLV